MHKRYFYIFIYFFLSSLIIDYLLFNFNLDKNLDFSSDFRFYYNTAKSLFLSGISLNEIFTQSYSYFPNLFILAISIKLNPSNFILLYFFQSIIIVFIFHYAFLIMNLIKKYSKDKITNELLLILLFCCSPILFFVTMSKGKELYIILFYFIIFYNFSIFNKIPFHNLKILFLKSSQYKFQILILILSIFFIIFSRSISYILIFLYSFFFVFMNLSKLKKILPSFIIVNFILFFFVKFRDSLNVNNTINQWKSLNDVNQWKSLNDGLFDFKFIWNYNPYIPDIIENILHKLSIYRYYFYNIINELDAYYVISENFYINSFNKFIINIPIIAFNSIFMLDFESVSENSSIFEIIFHIYSLLFIFFIIAIVINFKKLNRSEITIFTIVLFSYVIIYYVTPGIGTFIRYKLTYDLILFIIASPHIISIFNNFYLFIDKQAFEPILIEGKASLQKLKIPAIDPKKFFSIFFSTFLLSFIFSFGIIYREIYLYNNYFGSYDLKIYLIVFSFISLISNLIIMPIIETFNKITSDFQTQLLFNQFLSLLLYLALLLIFLIFLFELGIFYGIDFYNFNFISLKIIFVVISIPLNSLLIAFLIDKKQVKITYLFQLIIPFLFLVFITFFHNLNFNYYYHLLNISVFLNSLLLYLSAIKNGLLIQPISLNIFKTNILNKKIIFLFSKRFALNINFIFLIFLSYFVVSYYFPEQFYSHSISIKLLTFCIITFNSFITFVFFPLFFKFDKSILIQKIDFVKLITPLFLILLSFNILIALFVYLYNFDFYDKNFDFKNYFFYINLMIPIICFSIILQKIHLFLETDNYAILINLLALFLSSILFFILKLIYYNFEIILITFVSYFIILNFLYILAIRSGLYFKYSILVLYLVILTFSLLFFSIFNYGFLNNFNFLILFTIITLTIIYNKYLSSS